MRWGRAHGGEGMADTEKMLRGPIAWEGSEDRIE